MLKSLISGREVFPASGVVTVPEKTICISGHREKSVVPYGGNPIYSDITVRTVKLMLYRYIDMAVETGYEVFISGLATGIDLWAAEYLLLKKAKGTNIKLMCVMPFLKHSDFFKPEYIRMLYNTEKNADYLLTVCTNPDAVYKKGSSLYRDRNYYMVDSSSAVIAFFNQNNTISGTAQTLNYAKRQGKKIYMFGKDDVFRIIDRAGVDIRNIGREISFIKNIFDIPH